MGALLFASLVLLFLVWCDLLCEKQLKHDNEWYGSISDEQSTNMEI